MKKIIVEKYTPPPPPTEKVKIITHLTGKELVAYVTEAGTVCTLHRISKDYKEADRFGFFNLGYSDQSSPTFTGSNWFDAVKKAGASRELFAFDSYKDLIAWVTRVTWPAATKPIATEGLTSPEVWPTPERTEVPTERVIRQAENAHFQATLKGLLSEIPREEIDWNGSDQVNHTHKNMTIIFNKVNELVKCLNHAYHRNKARIFAMAYGGTPPIDAQFEKEEKEAELASKPFEMVRSDFMIILDKCIAVSEKEDQAQGSIPSRITTVMKEAFNKLKLSDKDIHLK